MDLRQPRKTWSDARNTRGLAKRNKVVLREEGWTRADEAHVAAEDIQELWQFVETVTPQQMPELRRLQAASDELGLRELRRGGRQGTELPHPGLIGGEADSPLPEE